MNIFCNGLFENLFISKKLSLKEFLAVANGTQEIAKAFRWPCELIILSIGHFEGPTEVKLNIWWKADNLSAHAQFIVYFAHRLLVPFRVLWYIKCMCIKCLYVLSNVVVSCRIQVNPPSPIHDLNDICNISTAIQPEIKSWYCNFIILMRVWKRNI